MAVADQQTEIVILWEKGRELATTLLRACYTTLVCRIETSDSGFRAQSDLAIGLNLVEMKSVVVFKKK